MRRVARIYTRTRIPCVRRHLLHSTRRHFTLRRACCSFKAYEIDCVSPLTGSARRDGGREFLHLPFAFFLLYLCVFLLRSFLIFSSKASLARFFPKYIYIYIYIRINTRTNFSFFVEVVSTVRLIAINSETSFASLTEWHSGKLTA